MLHSMKHGSLGYTAKQDFTVMALLKFTCREPMIKCYICIRECGSTLSLGIATEIMEILGFDRSVIRPDKLPKVKQGCRWTYTV